MNREIEESKLVRIPDGLFEAANSSNGTNLVKPGLDPPLPVLAEVLVGQLVVVPHLKIQEVVVSTSCWESGKRRQSDGPALAVLNTASDNCQEPSPIGPSMKCLTEH